MSRTGYHDPVLLTEVLERIPAGACLLMDGTLGHGGHSEAIIKKLTMDKGQVTRGHEEGIRYKDQPMLVGVDKDPVMLAKAQERLNQYETQMSYLRGSYADFASIITLTGGQLFDAILLDIGVNMEHFKDGSRGFSIKKDGPLDMRFDPTIGISAADRLTTCTTNQFHAMLTQYTDFSPKRIAYMTEQLFLTDRVFPTTFTLGSRAKTIKMNDKALAVFFQAIRIQVNGELDEFQSFLDQFVDYLAPEGRCIVLTYHSIEDRMAKIAFKSLEDAHRIQILTKHVIQPSRQEKQRNPAARSAKMRVVERR